MARTPSKEAHQKVLSAALRLIGDRGIEGTSMDAIAAESGVSKATVYKHWSGKDELLLEVIATMQDQVPEFDSGDPKRDMVQLIRHLAQSRKRQELGRIWVQVISYAITNPEFGRALQRHSFAPRRAQIQKILDRAIAKKQLRKEVEIEIALDLLIGPMMRRRFLDETVPDGWAELVVGYFWQIFRRQ